MKKKKKAARVQNNGYPIVDIDNSHDNVKKTEREICLERKEPTTIKGKPQYLPVQALQESPYFC